MNTGAFRNIYVYLRTNVPVFAGEMGQAGAAVKVFGRTIDEEHAKTGKWSAGWTTAGKVIAAGIGVAVLALGGMTAKAVDFERDLRNINSIAHLSEGELGKLGDSILKLSTRLPQSAGDLAKGLYDIQSSGFAGAEGLHVLEVSATAASAGLSSTATSAKAITATLNAYGLEATESERVSDALFQTVNLGVVSFEELASGLGDYVGMAAQAGVPIEHVGAALATMTLSGISAAEAGTSMNRVLQALIDPSEELASVAEKLGINLQEDLANPAIGLKGVMDQLREATGGNLAVLVKLFPEIRAARGALALMSNEGENYNRVFSQMSDQNKTLGATKAALAEQAKGLGYQLTIVKNVLMSWGIELGMQVIPGLKSMLELITSGAGGFGKFGREITTIGGNVIEIFRNMREDVGPLVEALLKLVTIPAGAGLKALGAVLRETTEFLSDHREIVTALATAYAASLLPQIAGATVFFGRLIAIKVAAFFTDVVLSVRAMGAALAANPIGAVITAIGAAIGLFIGQASKGKEAAREFADELRKDVGKPDSVTEHTAAVESLREELEKAEVAYQEVRSNASFKGFDVKGFIEAKEKVKLVEEALREAERAQKNYNTNLEIMEKVTGLSSKELATLAKSAGVDLSQGIEESFGARTKIYDSLNSLASQAGLTKEQLDAMLRSSANPEALLQNLEAVNTAAGKVGEAFRKDFSLISEFGGKAETTGQQIVQFYEEAAKAGEKFSQQTEEALKRGLDPRIVADLMAAGPKAAGPILEAILADSTGKTIEMVNKAEEGLRDISVKMVEIGRLTHMALQGTTDALSKSLPDAIAISQLALEGIKIDEIAKRLELTPAQIKTIADSFGITIDGAVAQVERGRSEVETKLTQLVTDFNEFPDKTSPAADRVREQIIGIAEQLLELSSTGEVELNRVQAAMLATALSTKDPQQQIELLTKLVKDLGAQKPTPVVGISGDEEVRRKLASAGVALDDLGKKTPTPKVSLSGTEAMIEQINRIRRELEGLKDKEVKVRTTRVGDAQLAAHGGIWDGGVQVFAQGGLVTHYGDGAHEAQVAGPGSWRVWAEPETGGEAYIPLAPAKRGRSTEILGIVAGRFGYGLVPKQATPMAAGGFINFGRGSDRPGVDLAPMLMAMRELMSSARRGNTYQIKIDAPQASFNESSLMTEMRKLELLYGDPSG